MKQKLVLFTICMAAAMVIAGCGGGDGGGGGGGGTAPTISSLKDAAGTTIETTGTTTVNPNSFTITFSEAMTLASLANITLACTPTGGTVLNAALVAAETSTTGAYTLAVTDAWKYALLSCVMTIPTTVTNSGGTAIATAATYTFTNPCAVSDDFNDTSISDTAATTCWKISTTGVTLGTWAAMNASIFSFNTAGSTLDANFTGQTTALQDADLYKNVSIGSGDLQMEIHFKSATGFGAGGQGFPDFATITLADTADLQNPTKQLFVGILNVNGGGLTQACVVLTFTTGVQNPDALYAADCSENTGYYIKLAKSGSTVTLQYKKEGAASYTDLTLLQGTTALTADYINTNFSGDNRSLYLGFRANPNNAPQFTLDSIYVSGVTMTSQY